MQDSAKWAERPLGMRDIYPQQARVRRGLENTLLSFFEDHGFDLVSCGIFEYVETLLRGRSRKESSGWVQLFDAGGRAMALRPDITPSIARMAAPLMQKDGKEIRWCYAERVYRRAHESSSFTWSRTRAAESTQVGVEWLGSPGENYDTTAADTELLAVCTDALYHLALKNWHLVVGHAEFTPAYLEAAGLGGDVTEQLLTDLADGNYVGFRQAADSVSNATGVLDALSALNPYHPESLRENIRFQLEQSPVGRDALDAWDKLVKLAGSLVQRGIAENIAFDLTLCRDLTYYTGIVFEVFAEGAGAPVVLGGRYDHLLENFGAMNPAIGFTFEIEGLMNVAPNTGEDSQ